jgi:hypothetical protein
VRPDVILVQVLPVTQALIRKVTANDVQELEENGRKELTERQALRLQP